MLSVHLPPPRSPAATTPRAVHGVVAPLPAVTPAEGGLWALQEPEMSPHLSHRPGELLCKRNLVFQDSSCILTVHSLFFIKRWFLPLASHLPPPAAGLGMSNQPDSVRSFSNASRTENYPAKGKYRWFLFYCLSEGLAQGMGWKEVWWK